MRELQAFYLGKRRVEMVTSHEVYRAAAAAAAAQLQWPGKKNEIHSLLARFNSLFGLVKAFAHLFTKNHNDYKQTIRAFRYSAFLAWTMYCICTVQL